VKPVEGVSGKAFVKDDLVISLHAYGKLSQLKQTKAMLRSSVPGKSKIVSAVGIENARSDHAVENDKEAENRNGGLFIDVRLADSVTEAQNDQAAITKLPKRSIEEIKAVFTSSLPEDGFIVFEPPKSGLNVESVLMLMGDAPQGVYSNDVPLRLVNGGQESYFFARIGDRFGKGVLRPFLDKESKLRELRVEMKLFIQPDGSRNLDARHYR
jgi:hypothetical protein